MDEVLTAGDRFRDKCKQCLTITRAPIERSYSQVTTDFVKNIAIKPYGLIEAAKAFGATDTVLAQYLAANPGTQQK
jgi:hypothetical protein